MAYENTYEQFVVEFFDGMTWTDYTSERSAKTASRVLQQEGKRLGFPGRVIQRTVTEVEIDTFEAPIPEPMDPEDLPPSL